MTVRSKIALVVAEFLGTGILATSVINISRSQIGIGYFVAFGVAITYALLMVLFRPNGGAHFNPAVTLGLWTLRKVKTLHALAFISAQILGGFAALKLAEYLSGQPFASTAAQNFDWHVLVAEMVGTLVFAFAIAAAIYQKYEGGKFAATVGAGLFAGVIVASFASNATLNPAIAFANDTLSRAYIFGPVIGAVVGMNLYALLFAPTRVLAEAERAANEEVVAVSAAKGRKTTARKVTKTTKTAAKKKPTTRRKTTKR